MALEIKEPVLLAYAEDHSLLRDTLIEKIEQTGEVKVIVSADNGADLIKQIKHCEVLPEVCLLDIEMPVMNGFETTISLKKEFPNIKIIILSGYETESYQIRIIKCGADAYLNKRIRNSELLRTILAVSRNEIYNSELFTNIAQIKRKTDNSIDLNGIEEHILKLCGEEHTLNEIAKAIGLSAKSIEMYRYKLYQKNGVKNRVGLLLYAIKNGYVKV